jgi:hypothetical protein
MSVPNCWLFAKFNHMSFDSTNKLGKHARLKLKYAFFVCDAGTPHRLFFAFIT